MEKETIDIIDMENLKLTYDFYFYNICPNPCFSLIAKSFQDIVDAKKENIKKVESGVENSL